MKNILYIYFLHILSFYSCISDYNGILPVSEPIPVLNGILHSDSLFSLNLTMSNNLIDKNFMPISDAILTIYKNDKLISQGYNYKSDGTYIVSDTSKNGDYYRIIVQIEGFPSITSETIIPNKPSISIEKQELKVNQRSNQVFMFNVNNITEEVHALYVFLFLGESNINDEINWEQRGLYCNSPLADSFNRFYDSWAPEGFSYEYESFIRFPVKNLKNNSLQTELAFLGLSKLVRFYVISATKTFDLYFKGGYLQRSFDPRVNLPFTYQPIFLPTNIIGGTGIFTGIDLSLFDFKN